MPEGDSAADHPRVALVLPGLRAGGTERVVATLANTMAQRGRPVTVVTFDGEDPYYTLDPRITLHRLAIPLTGIARGTGALQVLRRVRALRRLLRRERPDVVLSFLTKTNVISLVAARGSAIPVVVSERNNPERQIFNRVWRSAVATTYPGAAAFVTMTEGVVSCFPERQRPNATIIRNPVAPVPVASSRSDGRTFVAVGRLDPQKGFDLLLEAFARVAKDIPDWRLVIWGEGPLRPALEAQRDALGLSREQVSLPGVSARPGEWIESADAFVLSSRFEGWPNALAEAIAAGLPIVAFACRFGTTDMIRDGVEGLLVPPEDVGELAAALKRMATDDALRQSLGAEAENFAKAHTPDAIADQWERLVAEVASGRRRAADPLTEPAQALPGGRAA